PGPPELHTLSLHDALPISDIGRIADRDQCVLPLVDRVVRVDEHLTEATRVERNRMCRTAREQQARKRAAQCDVAGAGGCGTHCAAPAGVCECATPARCANAPP